MSAADSNARGLPSRRLGDLLLQDGLLTQERLDHAVAEQRTSSERLGAVLVRLGYLTEEELVAPLSRQYGLPALALSQLDMDPEVRELVPATIARRHQVLPIRRTANTLTVATADPTNVYALDDVGFITNLQILPVVVAPRALRQAIERLEETEGGGLAGLVSEVEQSLGVGGAPDRATEPPRSKGEVLDLAERTDDAPVVRLVDTILTTAIRRSASDVHFEPYETVFRVRFRIDGVLHEITAAPRQLEAAVTSRIKIMAALDIAERRLPQDGRVKLRYQDREIDFRVSTLPTIFGEKTVMRVLDKGALQLDLALLGFDPWSLEQFQRAIRQSHGLVLITGPTGSGKTTTLYSAIHTINRPDINIVTVEDPVEYDLKGVNQVQVNEEIGRSFAAVLRTFLRQDPDVLLVGETRDLETAQIGIRAALTGHLVLTTLHTNDCPSTVARLLDMGIPPYLVASSLSVVLAQRLARRVCEGCKEPYEIPEEHLDGEGQAPAGTGRITLARGRGCAACGFTGLKGRVAVYEVMPISEELRDLILRSAPTSQIRDVALREGMKTLRQNALDLARRHGTTLDEVFRVTVG
jgi:type IV pilus assembly protein PilB